MVDVRRVRYPFHPWFDRDVYVLEQSLRQGQAVYDCRLDTDNRRCLEIPVWMFDPAICVSMTLSAQPGVSLDALLRLRQLLNAYAAGQLGIEDQHLFPSSKGDADAPEQTSDTSLDTSATTSSSCPTDLDDAATPGASGSDPTAGSAAARPSRPRSQRLRSQGGQP